MSNLVATDFSQPHPAERNDMLARLYREIGLSAVAAALDVMTLPSESGADAAPTADQRLPAILEESLVA
jgi:hypothetical protein